MYKVTISKKAQKNLYTLPMRQRVRVAQKINVLAKNPFIGKKLSGEYAGQYSLRVVPYRIIYIVNKKEIEVVIVNIGHRQGVY